MSFTKTEMRGAIRSFTPMDFEGLVKMVREDDSSKRDVKAVLNKIRVDQDFNMGLTEAQLTSGQGLITTKTAKQQFCERAGLPFRYLQRVLGTKDEVIMASFADQANYFAEKMPDNEAQLRLRSTPDGDVLRAILSERYIIFDNHHVLEALRMLDGANMLIDKPRIKEDSFSLRLVLPDFTFDLNPGARQGKDKWRDMLYGMITLFNSETGRGGIHAKMGIFRLICTNGMTTTNESFVNFRQSHIGHITTEDIYHGLTGALNEMGGYVEAMGRRLDQAQEVPIEDPLAEIRAIITAAKLSKKTLELVTSAYNEEPNANLFGVTNAFTLAAQSFEAETRFELEALAGDYLTRRLAAV